MKKLIALAVVAAIAATLVGCGPGAATTKPAAGPTGSTPSKAS